MYHKVLFIEQSINENLKKHRSKKTLRFFFIHFLETTLHFPAQLLLLPQLGALGLVITIVVWNTRYIESALQVLQNRSHMIDNDDISRLSSLDHKHINYSRKVFIYSPRRSKKRTIMYINI
ncbi:Tn3 family transposase [Bacillus sp. FSL L8-0199]|uniref:Tn3 family transposase n=1 Tax=unclassified Bacillus (in: firmicutes) TaxID=185979 RepID=UPI0020A5360C|nr:Tn3 family transposase [Bacillus cereus]